MPAADDDPERAERLERARRAAAEASEPADQDAARTLEASDLAEAMWLCPHHSAEELNDAHERFADQIAAVRHNHPRASVGGVLAQLVYFSGRAR
jgi:hypothetical protein